MLALLLAGSLAALSTSELPATLPLSRAERLGLPTLRDANANASANENANDEPGRPRIDHRGSTAASTRTENPPSPPKSRTVSSARTRELTEEAPPAHSKVVPAIVMGGSIVAGVVGAVFAVRTMQAVEKDPAMRAVSLSSTNRAAATTINVPDINAVRAQEQEVLTNGLVATMSLSAAVAGLVTSTILLLYD